MIQTQKAQIFLDNNRTKATSIIFDNALALIVLVLLNFLLPRLLPGDPVDALLGEDLIVGYSQSELFTVKSEMGLTGSLWSQFYVYISTLLRGDLGYSFFHGSPVVDVLLEVLPWTLFLLLCAIPVSFFIGSLIGISAGINHGRRFEKVYSSIAALIAGVPSFAIALMLLGVFAVHLEWFPLSGASSLFEPPPGWPEWLDIVWHAALPILALVIHSSIRFYYLARGSAISINPRPFILAAKFRGIPTRNLLLSYYFPNSLALLLSKLSSTIPMVVGASLFIEVVFAYPGVGLLLLEAIHNRDYPLIQGGIFLLSIFVLCANSCLDVVTYLLSERG